MATAYPLSDNDEEPDENLGYVAFFEEHLAWLRTIPLIGIPDKVKFEISVLFWITCIYEEWKDFLNLLGLDVINIGAIDFASSKCGITPLYLAFNGPLLRNITFGPIIEYFVQHKKYHILRHLKPFIEGLLSTFQEPHEPSAPELEPTVEFEFPFEVFPVKTKRKRKPRKKKENDDLQKSSLYSSLNTSQREILNILGDEKPAKHVPENDNASISVFIPHTMSKINSAKKLQQLLRKQHIKVTILADIRHFLRSNHAVILTAMIKKVDYVIPFISEELLQQIDSKVSQVKKAKDIETIANRFVYTLLLREYSFSQSHRVRPIYKSSKSVAHIVDYPMLTCPFHWNEINDLVEDLRENKKFALYNLG